MNKIIRLICSLIISFLMLIIIFLLGYLYIFNPVFLKKQLKKIDYITLTEENITSHFDQIVTDIQIQKMVSDIITREQLNRDINRLIDSLLRKNDMLDSIKDNMKAKISETINNNTTQQLNQDSVNILSESLANSYILDLYPYKELKKLYILDNSSYLMATILFLILIIILFILISTIFSNKRPLKVLFRSNFLVSISLIFVYIFYRVFNLFLNIYYANSYFSLYFQVIIKELMTLLLLIGLIFLVGTIITEIIMIRYLRKN